MIPGTDTAADAQVRSWRRSGKPYQQIVAEIAVWARDQERGTVLPDNSVFGRKAGVDASPSTFRRAKTFLVTHGVLCTSDVRHLRCAAPLMSRSRHNQFSGDECVRDAL